MAIPVTFSTGSLYNFGLERVYAWAAEAGYDGVEIMMDERWDTHQVDYLNLLSEKHGLPIRALHPPLSRGAWNLEPEENLVRATKLAARIGADVVVGPSAPRRLAPRKLGQRASRRSQGAGGRRGRREYAPKVGSGASSLAGARNTGYKPERLAGLGDVTLDTSHLGASGIDVMEAWQVLGDQLRHVHLSDSNLTGRDEHRVPGRGRLPLKPFLSRLAGSGYPGVVSLELKPWPLAAPDPAKILDRMREGLEYTREGLD